MLYIYIIYIYIYIILYIYYIYIIYYIYCPKFAGFKNIRLGFAHFEMAIDHPKPSAQNTHRHVLWLDPSVGISPSRIRRVRICENCISFDLECLNQFCAFPPKLPYASKSLPVSWLLKDTAHFGTSTKIILEHQNLVMLEHQKNVFLKKEPQSIKPPNFLRYLLKSV